MKVKKLVIYLAVHIGSYLPSKILKPSKISKINKLYCSIIARKIFVLGEPQIYTKICDINKGNIEYSFLNFSCIHDILARCLFCEINGYIPNIKIKKKNSEIFLWDSFFVNNLPKTNYIITDKLNIVPIIRPNFRSVFNIQEIELWGQVYKKYLIFNEETLEYLKKEEEAILKDFKVLGVLIRGTDYIKLKPSFHPIQPNIEDVIELCRKKMFELGCTHIYLATEEKNIYDRFNTEFPNMILINKRMWYDKYYSSNINAIGEMHFNRKDDDYRKSLEYLSSINLLSKCSSLIAGNCGGSMAAVFMNNLCYEYMHIFDCGFYE